MRASLSFSKYALRERGGAQPVELGLAVLLQRLADHLGGQPRLHVLEALDRVVAVLDLRLVLVLERGLGELLLQLRPLQPARQLVALPLHRRDRLAHGQLLGHVVGVELGLERLDLGVLGGGGLLQLRGELRLGELDGAGLVLLGRVQALLELGVELLGAHLRDDVGVTGLVNGEGFAAVRAGDLMHGVGPLVRGSLWGAADAGVGCAGPTPGLSYAARPSRTRTEASKT